MPIRVIGLNSRSAPIDVREMFSFDITGAGEMLRRWRERFPNVEAALLSTCNRTELYFASDHSVLPDYAKVFPFLVPPRRYDDSDAISYERFRDNFQSFEERAAVKRLFSVASSLDSMVLGEPQILSQVKRAYQLATSMNSTGPILNEAFQTAFKTAKRVSVETEVFRRRVSVPSVAVVDFALNIFERLNDKKTLVLGAGEMAEETLKYLSDYGVQSVVVANRSHEKAERLAARWHGSVIDWNDRFHAMTSADLVIVATGASEPIVTYEDYLQIESARNAGKSLFILDLAVPRNVDPQIGKRPNVYLYSIDDLKSACAHNKELRDKEIPKALKIIDDETAKFFTGIRARKSIDAICQLRNGWNEIKDAELERLLRKLNCDQHTEDEIRYAFARLVNKLLHSPTVSLRNASENESSPSLVEAIKGLFRLK
ncbi:MAG: glutamyl-tRNA reductase [Thermoguttaceae bacterium]|jgi:glutamyl-tRNA reductase